MTRRVIVHADDFGLHPAINEGIEQAHRDGLVTSASLMPVGPAFDDAVRRCCTMPNLDIGLHFALVGISPFPPTLSKFLASYATGQLPFSVITDALRQQLDRTLAQGITLSHIDSHQHLHTLPAIMRSVCSVAAEYQIPAVRVPQDGPAFAAVSQGRRIQAAALAAIAKISRRIVTASGIRTSDHFSGMAVSGHLTASIFTAYLSQARPGLTEIVCHPGSDNATLCNLFDWGYDWEGEAFALCSAEAQEAAVAGDIQLVGWGSL